MKFSSIGFDLLGRVNSRCNLKISFFSPSATGKTVVVIFENDNNGCNNSICYIFKRIRNVTEQCHLLGISEEHKLYIFVFSKNRLVLVFISLIWLKYQL